MAALETRLLWKVTVTFGPIQAVGKTPHGMRLFVPLVGGVFEGPRIRGTLIPGGADSVLARPDGVVELDIRLVAMTDDGPVYVIATGLQSAKPEVSARLQQGEPVDPSEYYMRAAYRFETASQKYEWLNRILAVARYRRTVTGIEGDVFEVL